MLTEQQRMAANNCLSNPHNCISDAWFYAVTTGQHEVADSLEADMLAILDIANELKADGLLPYFENGVGGREMQEHAEAHQVADERYGKILAITRHRFMVSLLDPLSAADMQESIAQCGHPGEAACWNAECHMPGRTLN